MNKLIAICTIALNLMISSQYVQARPSYQNASSDENGVEEKRREREERGVRRLQQHKWQAGYVMPQHYRGDGYKVEYRDYNLSKPGRNQQWYKINNDFILVDADNNNIIQIRGQ
ncbi:nickel/cobalt transporter regulator [Acinetobacter calcoaceticus]|uniref:Nickel/cobalt transporter regulator n=1 Tax=Acinetobacter calcoaceticus TaxID=471 RepID=A0A4R1XPZ0_ACICA|nr:nickel/cobalt transporter regulator [Acinetobacter calcoaceticus]